MRLRVIALFSLIGLACSLALPAQQGTEPVSPSAEGVSSADSVPVVGEPTSATSQSVATGTVLSSVPALSVAELETIVLPISIYILDDESGQASSSRSIEQLEEVYEKVNEIWAQAGIRLEIQTITRITIPPIYLEAIGARDFRSFFNGARNEIDIPNPSLLNGFYAQDIGGPNGITPSGTHVFFVTDFPSVHHERVTAHEIGHILGLHHTLEDPNRLIYPGTNGMTLTEEEIIVARYGARGLLAGVR